MKSPSTLRSLRFLATSANGAAKSAAKPQFAVFDRDIKRIQKSRPAIQDPERSRKMDYLRDEVAMRTIERLSFITRDFSRCLDFGAHLGNFLKSLLTYSRTRPGAADAETQKIAQLNKDKERVRLKIHELVMLESSPELLARDVNESFDTHFDGKVVRVAADEESFDHKVLRESEQYDAVISNLSLHWINDLPQTLANINRVLKPDGLFMGTIFGGDTLFELRTSLQLAELERCGGVSPRVSPLVHLNDIGSLLNRAGFSMLTIDSEDFVIGGYPDIVSVCTELQDMGEQNSLLTRANTLPRDVLLAANEIYKSLHGENNEDGATLPATFHVIFMIGWKKSDSQPQTLPRGSGQVNLKEVL